MLRRHGLMGLRSAEKFVPDAIFGLGDEQLARFLGVMYACDGHVYCSDRLAQIGYTTISKRLAHDVQHLLLRLGIVATIRTLKRPVYDGTGKVAREIRITSQEGLRRFCELISVPGKEEKQAEVIARLDAAPRSTNTDTLPVEIWDDVLLAKGDRIWAAVSELTGRPRNHNWHVGAAPPRGLVAELATATASPTLEELCDSDIWWDEVVSVEYVGEEETYDLDVPGLRNFVADDVIVHNSALVANIAENVAVKRDMPVAFFSLEMSEVELAQRFIACRARISGDKLRKGQVSQRDWPKVVRACNELEEAPLWFDDSSDLGILDLRAKARRLHAQEQDRGGLGLIILDYMQLMRSDDHRANRVEQVGQISRGLKILARELEVPVVAISQLSRAPEQRTPPKPQLSDLRESGQIEQDADVVAFLFREDYYRDPDEEPDGLADLIIAKHRNGPIGTRKLVFLDRFPKFADFSGQDAPIEQGGPPLADAPPRGLTSDAGDRPQRALPRPGALPARGLRRLRLDPRPRRRGPPLRLPRTAPEPRPQPRRRLGDPPQVPGRLLRPPAGQRPKSNRMVVARGPSRSRTSRIRRESRQRADSG